MKVKTSITLSEDIVKYIDVTAGSAQTRSEFIENALRDFIAKQQQKERDLKDLSIINRRAEKLNKEAEDVLSYQVEL
ncbi:MAG: ribbon-helix-helix domain-containing protein [Nitrospirae bacterium]|nr:ribbon-helix-helix domain-containing protein [Nitrospirota bacterium]MCL5977572.1 ribbon-helix-helix domain-containing protein [Nitrospirota bacterium]